MTVLTSLVRPHPRTVVSAKVAFLAVVSTQFLAAATYYVSPAGSDSNNGSSSAPFRTIAKGVSAAAAGDTILLADGTYGNEGNISDRTGGYNGYATPVDINKAGRSDAWITLKAQNKGKAILDCGTTTSAMGCDKNIYLHSGAQYWSFEDMVFTRGAWGGIGTDEGASHIRIKGNEFKNIGYWDNPTTIGESAMGFDKNAVDWWIEGNVIHDIGRSSTAILDHGIYAHGTNATIINNVFYNMTDGWAVHMADGTNNWLIANNTFAFPHTTQTGHIMFWNSSVNVAIRNNIFYNPGPYAISRYTANISNCSVDHNIIVGGNMMSDSSGCSVGSNISSSDPKFANVGNFDFHVMQGGPGIDQGVAAAAVDMAGVARPQGSAPDIGAYEYVAGTSGGGSTAAPSVSAVAATAVTFNSAVISWATNTASSSSVQYGYYTGNYAFTSPVDSTLLTVHSVALTGLSQNTDYYYRVVSKDANGNTTNSSEFKFTTPQVDASRPGNTTDTTGSTGSTGSTGGTTTTPSAPTTPPTSGGSGPVAMWDFDANTGNTTPDSSGNNNTGTLTNVTWRGDICSGCATFSGINSYINVADSPSVTMTSQLTVAMWVMAGTGGGTDQRLIAKNYSWDVKLNGSNRYPQFSGAGGYAVMNTPMQVGMWQHLVMTFANGTVKGYMNGQPVNFSANTINAGAITNYAYGLRLGADSDAQNNFSGTLDDVRLYNRALSDAEVANLYSSTIHASKSTGVKRARTN